jgi:hypothetical protein
MATGPRSRCCTTDTSWPLAGWGAGAPRPTSLTRSGQDTFVARAAGGGAATVLDELTTREAAWTLGIPPGTVKTRMMRARAQLRQQLA